MIMSRRELEEAASPDAQLVACALFEIATALRQLGVNNAATEMGAIEAVAMELKEGAASIALAIDNLALSVPTSS